MDDATFRTELLARLDRIQGLLSYLCNAAKASEERARAELAARQTAEAPAGKEERERSPLQEEMEDDYLQAVQKWKENK